MIQRFIARQLAQPSGLFGRLFTARLLNKANARMNQITFEQLAIEPNDRILEIGFGGADLLERMLSAAPTAYVAGIDLSADMVRLASRRLQAFIRAGRLEVRCGNIEGLPYVAEEFTKLCSVNTIYFWRDPAVALMECRRVLKPGGKILLCFNSREDLEKWPMHKHGFRLYEVSEVENLLKASGFEVIKVVSSRDADEGTFYCITGA